jgi:hypothetical protein
MNIPSDFICPITMEIMVHPLATRYGQNFERSAIIMWLGQGSGECPLTRKQLKISDLIHNHYLAAEIQKWREINGICCNVNSENKDDEAKLKLKPPSPCRRSVFAWLFKPQPRKENPSRGQGRFSTMRVPSNLDGESPFFYFDPSEQ